ncbi:MAG: NAD-dependent protein deacylase [Planctomycetaceae bacterium]
MRELLAAFCSRLAKTYWACAMERHQQEIIETVARILRNCRSILFVTGAGVSADSGVPTYRGIGGLYDVEATEEGLAIEEILSGPMLRSNPELTWKYLRQIGDAASGATFNRAHEVIAEMERHFPRVWTLTQNVDGFHRLAGSENVIEIHGNMRSLSCMGCSFRTPVSEGVDNEIAPRCPKCNAVMRPDVVLFGEPLPDEALAVMRREMERGFSAVVCVGTSAVFPYIQDPVFEAKHWGAPTFEINPRETVLTHFVDYRLDMGAAEAMDAIWSRIRETE